MGELNKGTLSTLTEDCFVFFECLCHKLFDETYSQLNCNITLLFCIENTDNKWFGLNKVSEYYADKMVDKQIRQKFFEEKEIGNDYTFFELNGALFTTKNFVWAVLVEQENQMSNHAADMFIQEIFSDINDKIETILFFPFLVQKYHSLCKENKRQISCQEFVEQSHYVEYVFGALLSKNSEFFRIRYRNKLVKNVSLNLDPTFINYLSMQYL